MARLGMLDSELQESFARSSGPGGQHVNKVSTAVCLRWRAYEVTVQDSRSQSMNRQIARERLCTAVEETLHAARLAKQQAREKERRANAPRPKGVKKRILESKRRRSATKQMRQRPSE